MKQYSFGHTLSKRDRFGLDLNVGDSVYHLHAHSGTAYLTSYVVLGETAKKVRLGTLGSGEMQNGQWVQLPRKFNTTLVNPNNVLLGPREWPNKVTKEQNALQSGDYDG